MNWLSTHPWSWLPGLVIALLIINLRISWELHSFKKQEDLRFGQVAWTDEDLCEALEEDGFVRSDENLDRLKSEYAVRHLQDRMIETGWQNIHEAIADCKDDLEPTPEELSA